MTVLGRQSALVAMVLAVGFVRLATGQAPARPSEGDWLSYGRDAAHTHYSPLRQITPDNVSRLELAWRYRMNSETDAPGASGAGSANEEAGGRAAAGGRGAGRGGGRGAGGGGAGRGSQVSPLVIDGMMYLTTPYRRIVALDPSTGKELWVHADAGSGRGVAYWPGDASHRPAIIYHGSGGLVSIDAKTGKPNVGFGNGGVVAPPTGGTSNTSPPTIYRNVIISGTANPNRDGRSEDVRGFDAITGKQLWRFATIPEEGQAGHETWSPGSINRKTSSGTNVAVWGLMSVDTERGIVYLPLDSPQWERWGGDRLGDNLYGDSLVAVDALTGKYLWHFQITRHDLWDLDLAGAPVLFDVKRNGATIPAVGVIGKSGILFILNRVTGKPVYEVVERPVAQSDVPDEKSSPTQPFPAKLLPIARLTMAEDEIAKVTPEHFAACSALVKDNNIKLGGPYNPPGWRRPTLNFPGANGAGNWGGMSFNPDLGYLIVNTQDLGQITSLGMKGEPLQSNGTTGVRAGDSPTVPYDMAGFNGRFAIVKQGLPIMPCQEPPWGSLTAVNVHTWDIAWKVPLGITESLPPEKQNTGRPNLGSTATTASGLIFVGATDDSRFRAFDARNGKQLWETTLPALGRGGPTVFMGRDGRQYVAIVANDVHVYALR